MLSSMTPTIVEKDGKLMMLLGTPGGATIITSVFQVILYVTLHGMTMYEAVNYPRFHHQWMPDEVRLEPQRLNSETRQKLEQMGHVFTDKSRYGSVDAILVLPDGRLEGAADQRLDDTAEGI